MVDYLHCGFCCSTTHVMMSAPKEDDVPFSSELLSDIFQELVDCMIVDVASESHRIARLGLDCHLDEEEEEEELRLSAEARSRASDTNAKYVVDIFGQTHPAIADEIFKCMNCNRPIVAGRFAPHLEKCMGKGRKARLKSTRSATAAVNSRSPYFQHKPFN